MKQVMKVKQSKSRVIRKSGAALALAAVMILSICFAGCAEELPDEAEVLAAAESLVTEAVEVNRIFFWNGPPHEAVRNPHASVDAISEFEYIPLRGDYKYYDEVDLLQIAEAVYTKDYCNDIRVIAFEGIENKEHTLYARFVVEGGVMKINRKLATTGLPARLPVEGSVQVERVARGYAEVSAEFVVRGEKERQTLVLRLESEGWRLDTPTY